jgi:predicted nucleotide-binding protein (sugar kinase/HSP70/actin superfamily)
VADAAGPTLIFGGLTRAHHACLEAAFASLGYRARALPVPDNQDLEVGRQHANRGWCNPVYYTAGNLVRFLLALRAAGEDRIAERYAFLTVGSCGPCRFGMYADAYRRALRETGFDGLPIVLIDQVGGLRQDSGAGWLRMDRRFFFRAIRAIIVADLLNDLAHRIRPYEVDPGATEAAVDEALRLAGAVLARGGRMGPMLRAVRRAFDRVAVDLLQPKPVVRVTGEFWAQTTEGDANYRLFRWLEAEGAEVHVEPVAAWVDYLAWAGLDYVRTRLGVPAREGGPGRLRPAALLLALRLGQALLRSTWERYRRVVGGRPDPLAPQGRLARCALPYYCPDLRGGEGHLEVARHVDAAARRRAHLVLSIKPFGCLPSTMSDGVQYRVLDDLPGSLFLPVETTGDGEVTAKSRIQMALFEARGRARDEFREALAASGMTLERARQHLVERRLRPTASLPRVWAGTAANVVTALARH